MTTEMDLVALEKRIDEQLAEFEGLMARLKDAGEDVEFSIAEEVVAPLMAPIGVMPAPLAGIRG